MRHREGDRSEAASEFDLTAIDQDVVERKEAQPEGSEIEVRACGKSAEALPADHADRGHRDGREDVAPQDRHLWRHRAKLELDRQERFADIGRMSAGVAHEIRNPLNAVALTVQRILKEVERAKPDTARMRDLSNIIRQEMNRMDTTFPTLPGA